MSADDFAVLDNLEMIVVVDNETDTLSSIDAGVDQVARDGIALDPIATDSLPRRAPGRKCV